MTPLQQRIAIAKACGLTVVSDGITHCLTPCILDTGKLDPAGKGLTCIPDYRNSLDAMHEAENTLTNIQRERYRTELIYHYEAGDVFATAAQRAEAFLRALNLWKE